MSDWAQHRTGRVFLHLACICRGGKLRHHATGLWRQLRECILIGLFVAAAGCGQKSETTTATPGLATQGSSLEAATTYADADLAELTRQLRRWIVQTKQRPASFEDFVAKAKITVPAAPAGKKFALSQEMRIVLVDK